MSSDMSVRRGPGEETENSAAQPRTSPPRKRQNHDEQQFGTINASSGQVAGGRSWSPNRYI